jgi:hypothetical protein
VTEKTRKQHVVLCEGFEDRDFVDHFHGRSNARRAAKVYLLGGASRPGRLVINLDSDAENGSREGALEAIRQIARHYGAEGASGNVGPFYIDDVRIFPVIWECADPETPGVPGKQTLERLVTAAIQASYPDRGPVVADYLAAEPRVEVPPAKSYSYSYYAKWYGNHGVGDFFKAIWLDEAVARQLRERLETSGAWETVASLVDD